MRNLRWYSSPQPRFFPVLGFGVTTTAGLFSQRLPNFPRVHSDSFSSFKLGNYIPGQHIRRITLTWNSLYPQRNVKSSSTLKMTPIMSSLSSLADHVSRKEPRTDSLSVNKTTRLDFRKLRQDLTAAKTVFCPLDMMSSNVALSTASLKKNKVFPDMSTTMPPRPLYFWRSKDAST